MVNGLVVNNNINLINNLNSSEHNFRIYRIAQNVTETIEMLNYESNNIDIILLFFKTFGSNKQTILNRIEDKNKYHKSCIIICNKKEIVKTLYNNSVVYSVIYKCSINRANNHMYYGCDIEKLKKYFILNKAVKPTIKTVINTIVNKVS